MSEKEFWDSTLNKITKLFEYYQIENGLIDVNNSTNEIINNEKTINKWGRPITYSNDF